MSDAAQSGKVVMPLAEALAKLASLEQANKLAEADDLAMACLGIFVPVELRQTGIERRHCYAEEANERRADCCFAAAD